MVLSGAGRGSRGRDNGSDLTNIHYKPTWNSQLPPYNEHILIKKLMEKNK
jgi:hypothetical protein